MGFFSFLDFGGNAIRDALQKDAIVIDVRPPYQYDQGKVRGSLNIPIEQIAKNARYISSLKRPVIICGNGSESGTATRILQQYGIKEVYNAGSWERVLRVMKSL